MAVGAGGGSIFGGLPAAELREELDGLRRQKFESGAVLIATGDRSHRLMLVESGSADVFVADRHGVEHRVGGAVAGSILGEMALLTNEPSACTVRAATKVEATVLEPADFERVAARFPAIYRNLGTILARKLVQVDRLAAGDTLGRLVLVHDRGGPPLAAGRAGMVAVADRPGESRRRAAGRRGEHGGVAEHCSADAAAAARGSRSAKRRRACASPRTGCRLRGRCRGTRGFAAERIHPGDVLARTPSR